MSGWLAVSKTLADRRSLSRILFLVSIEAAATVRVPVTCPAAVTVPVPVTWPKTPCSGSRPQVCLVSSRTWDLAGSRVQDPVSVPSWTSACSAEPVNCPCDVMSPSTLFVSRNRIVLIAKAYRLGLECQGEAHQEGKGHG